MAAISTAMFTLLKSGDEIVCSAAIYGGTFHIIEDLLSKVGITHRFVSLDDLANPGSVIGPKTKIVWFESPINPTLRCVDVRAVAAACKKAGVISAIDNTFASPINQPVLSMGIDLSMQSCTKYLNGHSDVTGGALSGSRALLAPMGKMRRLLGGVMDPQPAFALGRGMKTMPLRVAQHNKNALTVAQFLEGHPKVERVYYPGLTSHPDHAIAARQMSGFGGMVTIDVKGGKDGAFRTFDNLKVIKRAASLGGVESICSLPILTSQYGLTDDELVKAGVSKGMIRISVGLEDSADLIDDLDQALLRIGDRHHSIALDRHCSLLILLIPRLVQKLEHEIQHPLVDAAAFVGPEFLLERFDGDHRFRHRAMAAGAADVVEPPLHEITGVA